MIFQRPLVLRRLTGVVIVVAVVVCGCLTKSAFARPSAAQRTARCSLAHGQEGETPLPFFAIDLSCAAGRPVVAKAASSLPFCKHAGAGCRTAGFVCRDTRPLTRGMTQPGDIIRCTHGRQAIKFELPG
jgi:hypothetical protein